MATLPRSRRRLPPRPPPDSLTMLRSIKNRLKGHTPAPAPAPASASSRPEATRTPKADTHLPRRQRRCVAAHAPPRRRGSSVVPCAVACARTRGTRRVCCVRRAVVGCDWAAQGLRALWRLAHARATCAAHPSRRSSIIREEKVAALRDLPMLKDTSLSKREVSRWAAGGWPGGETAQWLPHSERHAMRHQGTDAAATTCAVAPPDPVQAKARPMQRDIQL